MIMILSNMSRAHLSILVRSGVEDVQDLLRPHQHLHKLPLYWAYPLLRIQPTTKETPFLVRLAVVQRCIS